MLEMFFNIGVILHFPMRLIGLSIFVLPHCLSLGFFAEPSFPYWTRVEVSTHPVNVLARAVHLAVGLEFLLALRNSDKWQAAPEDRRTHCIDTLLSRGREWCQNQLVKNSIKNSMRPPNIAYGGLQPVGVLLS